MKVKVRALSLYKDVLGGNESLEVSLPPGSKLGDLLDHLQQKYPKLKKYRGTPLLNILVNGTPLEEQASLSEGDEVALMPLPSGG